MKTIFAVSVLAALAAALAGPPSLPIAVLLFAGAVFGARAWAAWPGEEWEPVRADVTP